MHKPVLLEEVLKIFDPRPGGIYIDATANGGGHLAAIAEKIGPAGKILGIDRDCELVAKLEEKINKLKIENAEFVCDNFANIAARARRHHLAKIDGILFDLGFSSYHTEESGRGFSFLRDEPLDMRYNPAETIDSAAVILSKWPEQRLVNILSEYGEERFAKNIAKEIVERRPKFKIQRTSDLVKIIQKAVPSWYCRRKIHCATRTFQALRIAVNDELQSIETGVRAAVEILSPGGKLIVISFHSIEDRIVKRIFKERQSSGQIAVITKKVIRPAHDEIRANPKARSAKLRAVQKPL
ncbi:MAG: 16S rRNA (cytosine(1402)-N(4))-methyltransferase RsmH [Candidatus Sungiibacteriota bacterium]